MKKKRRGFIRIKRSKNTGLVVAIILILAAAMFSAQINPQPSGMASQPIHIPSNSQILCKEQNSPFEFKATFTTCCGSNYDDYKANNYLKNRAYKLPNEDWKSC
jgi:hypothetical protein